jgi:aryl-alcohol dehydrogenase-like predicted oxidoreductase
MEKRLLGRTGEYLSVVGFGGIVVMETEPADAAQYVARAIERGVNYFDVAPSYGNAQERLGPALEPYRDGVFLACKTEARTRDGASAALQDSLTKLRTDHFDLYQFHGVTTMAEVDQILGPGGAMEAFLEARDKGLIRFIGFSAHSEEAALALLDRFEFDSLLFPINWVSWYQGQFGPAVMQRAQEKHVGRLALKALAKTNWKEGEERRFPKCWYAPVDTAEDAALGLRFTLSRAVTSAVSPSHAELLWWACDAADRLTPLNKAEEEELKRRSAGLEPIFPHHPG